MAGWVGSNSDRRDVLTRMVEAMSGPRPAIEQQHSDGFAMATTRPALHPSDSHLAAATEADVVVGFAGYLHSTEPQQRQQPAQYCLQLYQRLGTEFPTELNGSFAVAVYDHRARKLLLATDRTATRALYYCQQKHFVFGSEVKAILEYPGISRKLNAERVCEFLAILQVIGPSTYYDHIKRVPAASVLTWDGTRCQISRYWEPRFDHADAPDIREHAAHAVAVLRRAMGRCCAGAERVGLMLSGGFDSRVIAAVSDVDMLCTTLHNVEGPEVATARRVAQALGYEHRFVPPAAWPRRWATSTDSSRCRVATRWSCSKQARSLGTACSSITVANRWRCAEWSRPVALTCCATATLWRPTSMPSNGPT